MIQLLLSSPVNVKCQCFVESQRLPEDLDIRKWSAAMTDRCFRTEPAKTPGLSFSERPVNEWFLNSVHVIQHTVKHSKCFYPEQIQ